MTSKETQMRDIDFFCVHKGKLYHFASNGREIRQYFLDNLFEVQQTVAGMPDVEGVSVVLNEEYISLLIERGRIPNGREGIDRYVQSFVQFANKGFYSYDWDWQENMYMLVASPQGGAGITNIPSAIPEPPDYLYPLNEICKNCEYRENKE